MTIRVTCPSCGRQYGCPDELAGRKVKCKACQAVIAIPAPRPRDRETEPSAFAEAIDEVLSRQEANGGVPGPAPASAAFQPGARKSGGKSSSNAMIYIFAGVPMAIGVTVLLVMLMAGGGGGSGQRDDDYARGGIVGQQWNRRSRWFSGREGRGCEQLQSQRHPSRLILRCGIGTDVLPGPGERNHIAHVR